MTRPGPARPARPEVRVREVRHCNIDIYYTAKIFVTAFCFCFFVLALSTCSSFVFRSGSGSGVADFCLCRKTVIGSAPPCSYRYFAVAIGLENRFYSDFSASSYFAGAVSKSWGCCLSFPEICSGLLGVPLLLPLA